MIARVKLHADVRRSYFHHTTTFWLGYSSCQFQARALEDIVVIVADTLNEWLEVLANSLTD